MPLSYLEACCRRYKNGTARTSLLSLVARLPGGIASPVVKKVNRNGSWNVMLILIRTLGD